MSALYGTVKGQARTAANRRGHQEITVAARSWSGSVTVTMRIPDKRTDADSGPEVTIEVGEGSRVGGREVWRGSLASLMLQGLLKDQGHKCSSPGCSVCDESSDEYMARKGF